MPEKILVVKPSSLGDVVHSLPFLSSLHACFPGSKIDWVIARGLDGLLDGHPMLHRLIVINKDTWKRLSKTAETVGEIRRLFRDLRNERYDLVVDLQGLLRSGIITRATGAPERIGFSEAREGSSLFYTRKVRGGRDVHAVDRYLKIASALGCATDTVEFPFPPSRDLSVKVRETGATRGGYCVLVPGARWKTKIWPAENFGRVASLLPMRSLVVGSRTDVPIAERVVRASQGKAVSLAGETDLQDLIAVMRDARIVISNDSGPMHIAAGFGLPVVAIFGPTSPVRTGPYGEGNVVIRSGEPCAPCYRKVCGDLKCMERITVEMVYQRVRDLIASRATRAAAAEHHA